MLVGGLTGWLIHKVIDKKEKRVRRETLFNLESHGITNSFENIKRSDHGTFVNSPKVREDYIPTHTKEDGRKLIQGHKIWTLIGQPQFNIAKPKKGGQQK